MVYLSFIILKPFLMAILSSFIIAFVFYPFYKKILNKTKRENLSAFTIAFLIVLIIAIPSILILNMVSNEVIDIYNDATIKLIEDKELTGIECEKETLFCSMVDAVNTNQRVRFYISGTITNLASSITRNTSSFLFSVPKKILNILIIFLLVFFLLKAGKTIWDGVSELLPLKRGHKDKLLKKFAETLNGVVYGYLVIALIEGIVGWIGFAIIGNRIALLLGIIIMLLALVPAIGASLVWVPASIYYIVQGEPIKVLVLVIAGLIIMFLDIWTRSKIIGTRADIHPIIIALGVLGGLVAFGPVGIVIGPVILSLLMTIIEIYQEEKDSFTI
ncbi:hypothetical protein CEE44_00415 [Candidatus Woesearchaeota archaeon B3_Woes]|nr:MAG: hypothetical protein CEE44_00415 [Candidatus Woesearchaeota archaeon B3_Woes]